jgi:ATP-dependent RNA helicase RhlE
MVFSATFPPAVEKLAQKIMNRPIRVAIGKPTASAPSVDQRLIFLKEEEKIQQLFRLLREETGSIIVFTRSKDGATRVWRSLHSRGVYDATYIHSDRLQAHREQALAEFKEGKYRILIATDVAGRGIHVDDVAHVINYDLPLEPEDYIHRIGRTGRKGASGKATSFATAKDSRLLQQIERVLGKKIPAQFAGSQAKAAASPHSPEAEEATEPRKNPSGHRPPRHASGHGRPKVEGHASGETTSGEKSANGTGDKRRRRRRRSNSGERKQGHGPQPIQAAKKPFPVED